MKFYYKYLIILDLLFEKKVTKAETLFSPGTGILRYFCINDSCDQRGSIGNSQLPAFSFVVPTQLNARELLTCGLYKEKTHSHPVAFSPPLYNFVKWNWAKCSFFSYSHIKAESRNFLITIHVSTLVLLLLVISFSRHHHTNMQLGSLSFQTVSALEAWKSFIFFLNSKKRRYGFTVPVCYYDGNSTDDVCWRYQNQSTK